MKKLLLIAVPSLLLIAGACTKNYEEKVKQPDKNSWFVNDRTFSAPGFTYDTTNLLKSNTNASSKGAIYIKFSKKPKADGDYIVRSKADEIEELAIVVYDSTNKRVYVSMDDDGMQIKKDQHARVTVNGGTVSVSFTDVWLKDTKSVEQAKVSANLN